MISHDRYVNSKYCRKTGYHLGYQPFDIDPMITGWQPWAYLSDYHGYHRGYHGSQVDYHQAKSVTAVII